LTSYALLLVLVAALLHASWNYLLKRTGGGGSFVWLCSLLTTLIYAPLAIGILWYQHINISGLQAAFMAGTAVLHTIYFLLLARGYRYGDLSLVYPLARGSGPLLTIVAAVFLLHESPSPTAVGGALLLAVGVLLLTFDPRKKFSFNAMASRSGVAIAYAMLTGATIASYTLWDKYAVATLLIPPLVLDWSSNLGRTAMLAPFIVRNSTGVKNVWRNYRKEVIAVAVFGPLSYIFALTAMVFTPVSYVAPAREISILFAALMGTQLLKEKQGSRRLAAAAIMIIGLIALALG
jgi:drug/metabolite transporter (DMT)-like permease